MSGGVDSSVAGALLLRDGHDVVGVTMKLWGGDSDSGCCSVSDVDDARRVAQQLDIDHLVFNFGDDFDRHVVEPYVRDHALGRDTEPVHRVQSPREVRPADEARRPARLRRRRHRVTMPASGGGDGRCDARARRRCRQGPELRRAHARPGRSATHDVPGGAHRQGRGPPPRGRDGPPHGDEARQPGRLLHHEHRRPRDVPRRPHPVPGRHGRRRSGRRTRPGRGGRDGDDRPAAWHRAARWRPEAIRGRRRRPERRRDRRRRRRPVPVVDGGLRHDVGRPAGRRRRAGSVQRARGDAAGDDRPRDGRDVAVTWSEPQRRVAPGQSVVFYDLDDRCVLGGGTAAR